MSLLKLGIIGMSEGNGHPYSWSAIFNGYDKIEFLKCPFTAIKEYLDKEMFPKNFLHCQGRVTHIWTQKRELSEAIAKATYIENIVEKIEEMSGQVDAILFARDDVENHFDMIMPIFKMGVPIFIDKPFSLNLKEAKMLLQSQVFDHQIFTCTSLRFATELILTRDDIINLGDIKFVEASIVKDWNKYGVHLIEPLVQNLVSRGGLKEVVSVYNNNIKHVLVNWENVTAYLKLTGDFNVPIEFKYFGSKAIISKKFIDTFGCFKASLQCFISQIISKDVQISREETMEIVEILEKGNING
jgi:hypothetical protein